MAKKGKYSRKSLKLKPVIMLLAVTLLVGTAIGGTIAWLVDTTDPKVNSFTVGDINIALEETENLDLKMIPGKELDKDPKVTVEAGSAASYVFVKVEESDNLDQFITYTVDSGWTGLTGFDGVYYRMAAASESDQTFDVLTGNKVTVNTTVTKGMMDAITNGTTDEPSLTFTAYAIQSEYLANQNSDSAVDAIDAWLLIGSSSNS